MCMPTYDGCKSSKRLQNCVLFWLSVSKWISFMTCHYCILTDDSSTKKYRSCNNAWIFKLQSHIVATLQRPCRPPRSDKVIQSGHYHSLNPAICQIKNYVTTVLWCFYTSKALLTRCYYGNTPRPVPTKGSFLRRCHYCRTMSLRCWWPYYASSTLLLRFVSMSLLNRGCSSVYSVLS